MPDLEELLAAEAARYDIHQPPMSEIRRRRKRRVLARTGGALAVVIALGAVAGVALRPGTHELSGPEQRAVQVPPATPEPTPEASPSGGPSQSEHDARRDGVLPEVAALPFAERVRIIADEPTSEGVWAITRVPGIRDVLGDVNGRYGVDWVAPVDYGELLLLDETRTRILRALPLPGVPAQTLLVHDDAVYCARQGDGGLPDSMLCRADRTGSGWLVRVFVHAGLPDPSVPVERPGWQRQVSSLPGVFSALVACPEGLCVEGSGATVPFHPRTLVAPYDRATAADTKEACRHIRTAYAAEQPGAGHGPAWTTVESELHAAWQAGRTASDPVLVKNLVAPGAVIQGDTQTLGDATDRLAGLCGIHIPHPTN
jgi:hypothetical protein